MVGSEDKGGGLEPRNADGLYAGKGEEADSALKPPTGRQPC